MRDEHTTQTKVCKGCGEAKALDEYSPQRLGKMGRTARCRACMRKVGEAYRASDPERVRKLALARAQRYKARHPERVRESARRSRERRADALREYGARKYAETKVLLDAVRTGPCVDCGIQLPPECMDLDHVRGEKKFCLSVPAAKGRRMESILEEIAKCELRCPNCHRLRHHNERNGRLC